ncbi:MAG: hypothetical protein WAL55_07985 [Candidatus Acidiferrales bacterium]
MKSLVTRRFGHLALAVLAAFICVFVAACGVPLAPGYQIQKESLTVHFVSGSPPHLAVRAEYTLMNVGTAPLDSIQFRMIPKDLIGRTNLQLAIDGQAISSGHLSRYDDSFDALTIPFIPAWKQKQRAKISITYDSTSSDGGTLSSSGFFYNGSDLLPIPIAPKSVLAAKPVRPDPTSLCVIVPSDFLVLSERKSEGSQRRSGEVVHCFRVHKSDPEIFILAGRYKKREIETHDGKVIFWTFRDLPPNDAASAAPTIAAMFRFLDANFGFHINKPFPVWIATLPRPGVITWNDFALPSFLYFRSGTLVNQTEIDKGMASPEVLEGMEETLVDGLFQDVITPRSDANFLVDGLEYYVGEAIRENDHGTPVRTNDITKLLQQFDDSRRQAVEIPVRQVSGDDSLAANTMALDKSLLLPFALEDKCGQQNVTHAIAHMVYALRGQEYGYSDFRAALEQECHQDLSDFFDAWLRQKGIPPDFRARYENAGTGKQ